jgi:hypothetical protein
VSNETISPKPDIEPQDGVDLGINGRI